MSKPFVILAMIFCHIVDDYYLQGKLADFKQKAWWQKNAPLWIYKYDYLMALFMHSFSWSFMIMLPIAFYYSFAVSMGYVLALAVNLVIHAFVDSLKANHLFINLIIDQSIHLVQIAVTATVFLT